MRELSLEYVAGFFDADGSVGIYRRGSDSNFQVCVAIANSGKHGRIICEQLVNRFGGTVTHQKKKKETHRDSFWWKINGRNVVKKFLLSIENHSVIKQDQIKECLLFIEEWEKMPRYKSEEQSQRMREIADSVKQMKREC